MFIDEFGLLRTAAEASRMKSELAAVFFKLQISDFWIWELEFRYWPLGTETGGPVPVRGEGYRYPVHFPQ